MLLTSQSATRFDEWVIKSGKSLRNDWGRDSRVLKHQVFLCLELFGKEKFVNFEAAFRQSSDGLIIFRVPVQNFIWSLFSRMPTNANEQKWATYLKACGSNNQPRKLKMDPLILHTQQTPWDRCCRSSYFYSSYVQPFMHYSLILWKLKATRWQRDDSGQKLYCLFCVKGKFNYRKYFAQTIW